MHSWRKLTVILAIGLAAAAGAANRAPKAWLGFGYTLHNFEARSPVRQWLYIVRIAPASPATESGLRVQDAIVAINGKPVNFRNAAAALDFFASVQPGTVVRLEILREGKRASVRIRARPLPKGYAAYWERNKALAGE